MFLLDDDVRTVSSTLNVLQSQDMNQTFLALASARLGSVINDAFVDKLEHCVYCVYCVYLDKTLADADTQYMDLRSPQAL